MDQADIQSLPPELRAFAETLNVGRRCYSGTLFELHSEATA